MASHASEEEVRGQGSQVQDPQERTAEGLGGSDVRGFDDPRTRTDLLNTAEVKPSDPEWVQRRDPATLPKYTREATGLPAGEESTPWRFPIMHNLRQKH